MAVVQGVPSLLALSRMAAPPAAGPVVAPPAQWVPPVMQQGGPVQPQVPIVPTMTGYEQNQAANRNALAASRAQIAAGQLADHVAATHGGPFAYFTDPVGTVAVHPAVAAAGAAALANATTGANAFPIAPPGDGKKVDTPPPPAVKYPPAIQRLVDQFGENTPGWVAKRALGLQGAIVPASAQLSTSYQNIVMAEYNAAKIAADSMPDGAAKDKAVAAYLQKAKQDLRDFHTQNQGDQIQQIQAAAGMPPVD